MTSTRESLTSRLSLGFMIDKAFGTPKIDLGDEVQVDASTNTVKYQEFCLRWKIGCARYQRLQSLHVDNPPGWKSFESSLGSLQLLSWRLLTEWLNGDYHSEDMAKAARTSILSKLPKPISEWSSHPEFPTAARIDDTVYQDQLSELYAAEFLDLHDETAGDDAAIEYFLQLLDLRRRKAFQFATSQHIAHVTYQQSKPVVTATPLASNGNWHYQTPLLEVCPWLAAGHDQRRDDDDDGYPYYLWDITSSRTVHTATMRGPRPAYTCVSHTWGRWRQKTYTTVQGVPWKVPNNSIFGVHHFPEMLKEVRSKITTDYLWFDLLCIPQTREGDLGVTARREISRQAAIFRNSEAAVIWLNYVDDWNAENNLLRWLSFQYLAFSTKPGMYETTSALDDLRKSCQAPIQLVQNPLHRRHLGKKGFPIRSRFQSWLKLDLKGKGSPQDWTRPSPWFSSLWTLQEALFCPHMTLMSRDWTALRDVSGKPVTLERLMAICQTVHHLMTPRRPELKDVMPYRGRQEQLIPSDLSTAFPMPASQLQSLLIKVNFLSNTNLSRTSVLVKGNARHCSESRAEAIMSVLDVRVWHDSNAEGEKLDLVLGMYPLPFVKEAAEKIGPEFLLGRKRTGSPAHSLDYFIGRSRGSFLPFESLDPTRQRGRQDVTMYPMHIYESEWHPACRGWDFLRSGSVQIRRAAILGANTAAGTIVLSPFQVNICWQPRPDRHENLTNYLLGEFLQNQPRIYDTFAVMISKGVGVFLQGFRFKTSSTLRLIKVGCFDVRERYYSDAHSEDWAVESQEVDWVPATEVDWIVL